MNLIVNYHLLLITQKWLHTFQHGFDILPKNFLKGKTQALDVEWIKCRVNVGKKIVSLYNIFII